MCGGTGNSFLETLTNVVLQTGTLGALGFESDKGLTPGITGEVVVDVTKELTGASAAEEANKLAREQFEEERATALAERETAKAQTAAEQLAISRQAGSVRAGGARATGTRFSTLGGQEGDFLGL